jgi:hypothetical protein
MQAHLEVLQPYIQGAQDRNLSASLGNFVFISNKNKVKNEHSKGSRRGTK